MDKPLSRQANHGGVRGGGVAGLAINPDDANPEVSDADNDSGGDVNDSAEGASGNERDNAGDNFRNKGGDGNGRGTAADNFEGEAGGGNERDNAADNFVSDGGDEMDCHEMADSASNRSEDEEVTTDDDLNEAPHFQNDTEKEQFVIDTVQEWAQLPGLCP
ncbi:hypothetical protein FOCC_FOCC010993 [Frankliniella occidentalis]|nr:hypothetical protein FOCC_FOCC010993 [Frankliniella occidentalis]